MAANSYNEIPYVTFPQLQTHPDRLAAVGTLFGMNPAPVSRCRVLEIGCGDAGNLIPMAYTLPESRFTGIDLADAPIAAGRRTIEDLGLRNISLVCADLRCVDAGYGEFDYILAHGVYSWVPQDVRDGLLAVCARSLAPQGIAFVSYNAYPGSHSRQMLREMMLRHIRNITGPEQRIDQAIQLMKSLIEGQLLPPSWQPWLEEEVKSLLAHSRDALYHDSIGTINDPVYFWEFAEYAGRHGLQYLGDAELHLMFDPLGAVAWLDDNVLEREQYLDYLRARRFRQTLLCRNGIPLRHHAGPEQMDAFLFSAPATPIEDGKLQGLRGICITSAHEAVYRVATAMGETYPFPLAFDELVPYAGSREALREILFGLTSGGFANLHVFDFPCEETVTLRPSANRLVRYQAAQSPFVTNACHHTVNLDEVARHLLLLMDGTRDHEQLARSLASIPGSPDVETIRASLPNSLEWLAGNAMLEG